MSFLQGRPGHEPEPVKLESYEDFVEKFRRRILELTNPDILPGVCEGSLRIYYGSMGGEWLVNYEDIASQILTDAIVCKYCNKTVPLPPKERLLSQKGKLKLVGFRGAIVMTMFKRELLAALEEKAFKSSIARLHAYDPSSTEIEALFCCVTCVNQDKPAPMSVPPNMSIDDFLRHYVKHHLFDL